MSAPDGEPTSQAEPGADAGRAAPTEGAKAEGAGARGGVKKRAKKPKKGTPAEPETLPGEGTPEGAMLREASAAFEAGNYALVRSLTAKLATANDPKIVDAAADLARRVRVDPVQIGFLVVCLLAICVIFYVYVIR